MGHFARECRAPRSKDNRNWNQGSSSKAVKIEDASEKAMYAIDGAGFDWSDMARGKIQATRLSGAFSDSGGRFTSYNEKEIVKSEKPVSEVIRQRFNTGRQNVNTVKARGFNAVKSSACWVWRPIKPNGASLIQRFLIGGYVYFWWRSKMGGRSTVKALASPQQTAIGKDYSNPLMAGSLPKTILCVNLSAEATTDDNGEVQIAATIDGHSMSSTEASYKTLSRLDPWRMTLRKTNKNLQVLLSHILRVTKLEAIVKIGKARRRAKVVLSEDDKDVEDDSSKQWKKLTNSEVQEKASTETEPFIQEVTPTKVIQDQGSSEKGSAEVSTADATKGTASEVLVVSTAEENLSTARRTITYRRRSEEKRIRKDKGKALIMTYHPTVNNKWIRTTAHIARDDKLQTLGERKGKAMAEAKLTKKIDWNETFSHTIFRGDGSSKNYKVLSEKLEDLKTK
ncbi:hypothetical protein Tco_0774224 [Tanacetum coccineum]|uniref:Uncharacterized protein n=1 Tax=Tanacetum coccineum TaxID=301880 RepID=A0ABQ4ZMX0_9ASTR